MFCLLTCALLYLTLSNAQTPYGATPLPTPFSRPTPSTYPTTLPTTVSSLAPTVPLPFGPNHRPFGPSFNHAYYDPAAGPAVPILTYSSEHVGDGTYSYSYSTADGKQVQENGYLKDAFIDNAGEPQGTQVVQGSYAYVAPDGTPIQVSYIADENGFRPSGVHIPADGKAFTPLGAFDGKKDKIFDPFNKYDPYNNRNHYNNIHNNPYNSFDSRFPHDPRRPYDQRHPYDPRYPYDQRNPYDPRYNNQFNPYRPRPFGYDKINKQEEKKQSQ